MTTLDEYRAAAAEGLTFKQFALRTGDHVSAIRERARRHGIEFKREADCFVDRVRACHEKGMNLSEAARALGVDRTSVRRVAARGGFTFEKPATYVPPGEKMSPEERRAQKRARDRAARQRKTAAAREARVAAIRAKQEAEAREAARMAPIDALVRSIQAHGFITVSAMLAAQGVRIPEATLGAAMARMAGQEARG